MHVPKEDLRNAYEKWEVNLFLANKVWILWDNYVGFHAGRGLSLHTTGAQKVLLNIIEILTIVNI